MSSNGPTWESPGSLPERDEFATKEEFLDVYPEMTELAAIYFPAEGDEPDEA